MNKISDNIVGIGTIDISKVNPDRSIYEDHLCKEALISALKSANVGENYKAPFSGIVKTGDVVLIKPNWVNHENINKSYGTDCLYTHPLLIEYILELLEECMPRKVIIGDAPIQGCVFQQIATDEWCHKLKERFSFPIEVIDFRQTILHKDQNKNKTPVSIRNERRSDNDFLLFDLGKLSALEEISTPSGKFRVVMYDHHKLNRKHKKGVHQYLVARELFEADIILNVPKLKTHKKAGITGALKNLVGICGSKDYLPHHRVGSIKSKGDNYPDFSILKRIGEFFIDQANIRIGRTGYSFFFKIGGYLFSLGNKLGTHSDSEGGWYGNDTVWRMVIDLNKIILYGNADGSLSSNPVRRIYTITDAIIAGDTDGPLSVEPVYLGAVTFSASTVFADLVHAKLMHFNWREVPLIKNSFNKQAYPIVNFNDADCKTYLNGEEILVEDIAKNAGKYFRAPKGWVDRI